MTLTNICDMLANGSSVALKTTPYTVNQLRQMAKAALKGDSVLTIVPGPELTATDIEIILAEAPKQVAVDLR